MRLPRSSSFTLPLGFSLGSRIPGKSLPFHSNFPRLDTSLLGSLPLRNPSHRNFRDPTFPLLVFVSFTRFQQKLCRFVFSFTLSPWAFFDRPQVRARKDPRRGRSYPSTQTTRTLLCPLFTTKGHYTSSLPSFSSLLCFLSFTQVFGRGVVLTQRFMVGFLTLPFQSFDTSDCRHSPLVIKLG